MQAFQNINKDLSVLISITNCIYCTTIPKCIVISQSIQKIFHIFSSEIISTMYIHYITTYGIKMIKL